MENLTLYIYDHEFVDEDNMQRSLEYVITTSREEALAKREITFDEMIFTPEEINHFTGLYQVDFKRELFAKFGRSDLNAYDGTPKGPYYRIDCDVYRAMNWSEEKIKITSLGGVTKGSYQVLKNMG